MKETMGISDYQVYLFNEGTNYYSYRMLGAHPHIMHGKKGIRFAVWAPGALKVSVVGDFNMWDGRVNPMKNLYKPGIWVTFIEGIDEYSLYKYEITSKDDSVLLKSDPYGFYSEMRPGTASKVVSLEGYKWGDSVWQDQKRSTALQNLPVSIYEVHLGSWDRKENGEFLTYRELTDRLADYASDMGYTHIELLPVLEHPLDDSWGYQVTGYFAITSRYGLPSDFMYFVDRCHQKGLGVILDWVPGHFPKDEHGLAKFDGTPIYEYKHPAKGEHKEWGTLVFDYGRKEVISFLISSAMFWLDVYHIDGLRVDAVSSMLYLDYGRNGGEWIPNKYGGRENVEAIEFMKKLNEAVYKDYPNTLMAAEESTAWPMVTSPAYLGGLGYSHKWNMGWMHDVLSYMSIDPVCRKLHHNCLTFSMAYAFSENFVLPLSHDEVVHGKKSLINKMYGDYWNKFSNLRALYGFMICHPGKKLIFMGGEFGQFIEWKFNDRLDWHLLGYKMHSSLHTYVRELNHFYLEQNALWENDRNWDGFRWIDPNDCDQNIISFIRYSKNPEEFLVVVCNFAPVVRHNYQLGVPYGGEYTEVFNSDKEKFGGAGNENEGPIKSDKLLCHDMPCSITIKVPPLAVVIFKALHSQKEKVTRNSRQDYMLQT